MAAVPADTTRILGDVAQAHVFAMCPDAMAGTAR
ncbi:hypothetical protein DER30_6762 [Streptomyces sp. HB202]|nr:hypothetical protein DER30_6762 [Streptomyces sp. HB202]